MNKNNAKDYLPLVQALAEGKTIQWMPGDSAMCKWEDRVEMDFSQPPFAYRIKPEPKLRPWRPEEVPVGALLKNKTNRDRTMIVGISVDTIYMFNESRRDYIHKLFTYWEHSLDNGKTWLPCGVFES